MLKAGGYMNKPKLLVIVRHGESIANVAKGDNSFYPEDSVHVIKGFADHAVPLTEQGRLQAEQTGLALKERYGTFDAVYDSGYLRTIQTRELLLKPYTPEELESVKIRHSHLIREREAGYTFDMTAAEANMNFPWLKEYFHTFGRFYARPPGGQSQADVCTMVHHFLGQMYQRRVNQKVLVVTHGHTTRAFRFNLENWTAARYEEEMDRGCSVSNCGVTEYRYNEASRRLELTAFNQVCY